MNIDFTSSAPCVKSVNLLKGFPFDNDSFDVVYSSHVLEHFTKEQAKTLLAEARRVLKPGGVLRIVVPDLENVCAEYLRVFSLPDSDERKPLCYQWMMIELLDQLTRLKAGGEMLGFYGKIQNKDTDGKFFVDYVRQRTTYFDGVRDAKKQTFFEKLGGVKTHMIKGLFVLAYLKCVKLLIPRSLRPMVFVETGMGERHQWMYDRYGLALLLRDAGFAGGVAKNFNDSCIPGFNEDCLDCNPDGTRYKLASLYFEVKKTL